MGGGTDGGASMRYQHTKSHQATSHNRSSGFSSVAEIAGGMGLRSPQPQQLALDFAPAQVRSHGLRDAHTYPQVAQRQGASFRVPASQAWGYPSLELRAGNSWPLMAAVFWWLPLARVKVGFFGSGSRLDRQSSDCLCPRRRFGTAIPQGRNHMLPPARQCARYPWLGEPGQRPRLPRHNASPARHRP